MELVERLRDPGHGTDQSEGDWLLGFDGNCAACIDLATEIMEISEGRISVISLHDGLAMKWRRESLGPDAPLVPTLFRVTGDEADVWTGPRMMTKFAAILGPRRALKVAEVLGAAAADESNIPEGHIGRRAALLRLSGIAAGLLMVARAPLNASALSPADCISSMGYQVNFINSSQILYTQQYTNCRNCPRLGSGVAYQYPSDTNASYRGYTTNGGPVGGNLTWWRTSGSIGCWVSATVL